MLAIMAKLDQFRGESKFTTWAFKFVMFEVSAKIGRHFWRRPPVALTAEDWDRLPDRFGFDPAGESERRDFVRAVYRAVQEDLTEHQRQVFVALVLDGIPMDALAEKLGSSRNAIYKTMFDTRRKLRVSLVANGYLHDEAVRRP
jgi:RNA polymerase sigma-70 factor (ECF subfamily)